MYVSPGENEFSPLQIAEAILSIHTETAISFFFKFFLDHFRQISTKRISKIETDFSLVLLNSCCAIFNDINLYHYINIIYESVESNKPIDKNLTILHVCSSHVIKTVRKKIIKIFPDKKKQKDERYVASQLITRIIHSVNFEEAKISFEQFIKIYGFKNKVEDFDIIINNFLSNDTKVATETEEVLENENTDDNDSVEQNLTKMKSSLYYQKFNKLKDSILEETVTSNTKNTFYSENLIKYLVDYLLVYFSLWSAAAIAERF